MRVAFWAMMTLGVSALFGCAATGPAFTPSAAPANDQTLIYIYRENSIVAMASGVSIAVDGKLAVTLRPNGYTRFYVKSGYRALTVSWDIAMFKDQHRASNFEAGKTVYMKVSTQTGSTGGNGMMLEYVMNEIPPENAQKEITAYKFLPPTQDLF
jgi:hypothetical protein